MKQKKMDGLIPEAQFKALTVAALRPHFDANDTFFLERELTQLRAKMYEIALPELKARQYMPFANDIAPSVNTYSYKVLTPIGAAKFVGGKANDIPRIDVQAREVTGRVHPIAASYGWDINELREAARLQIPISDIKAQTCRKAIERGIDEILCFGDFSTGPVGQTEPQLAGLLNNPDVIAQGIGAGTYWLNPTPETPSVILNDLNAMTSVVPTRSDSLWQIDTILLPQKHYFYAAQTPFSTFTGDSILNIFQKNNPGILIAPWYRLDTAGVSGAPRAVAYKRSPDVLEGVVPQEFEQLPPEQRGLEFLINATARCGGVKIYQPLAVEYTDFATS